MVCPYCGSEMENGFLAASTLIIWKHSKQKPLVQWTEKEQPCILVSDRRDNNNTEEITDIAHAASSYCRSCNNLITSPENPNG